MGRTAVVETTAPPDLRREIPDDVVNRVETSLGIALNRDHWTRKRRSLGASTARGTWVRIEVRTPAKTFGQGFNGAECAAVLPGIHAPRWLAGVSWHDFDREVLWRADETELIPDPPVKPGGVLVSPPHLSSQWWERLNVSLDALAGASTTRIATVHTTPMTQDRITAVLRSTFPALSDSTITEWAPAHGDLNWANLTAPTCWLLDWEDWGTAPRGLDAAMLWVNSLAVHDLAERIRKERHDDLESRSGRLVSLYFCAELLAAGPSYSGALADPAGKEADRLVTLLT